MDPHKNKPSSTPRNTKSEFLVSKHTNSTPPAPPASPASPQSIDRILRLFPSSFCFPRHSPIFHPSHRQSIRTALGALNRQGRAGKQATVLKRVTLIYRLAIQTHLFYPSYDLEAKTFWTTVLADIQEEEPLIEQELDAAALAEVVGVYTQAYANARGEEDDDDDNDDEDDDEDEVNVFDAAFEALTPKKRNTDPRKKLVSLVRVWAKLFRAHKAKKASKCTTTTAATTTDTTLELQHQAITNTPSESTMSDKLPNELDDAYIKRLQFTIKSTIAAEKTARDSIIELKRSQALADEYHKTHNARLHATIDRMDAKIKDLERELRLERIGAGGEDDPWVPWREYAGQLDGAS